MKRIAIFVITVICLGITQPLYCQTETKGFKELNFLKSGEYQIKNVEFNSNANSSDQDTTKCSKWKLTSIQIREILGSAEVISGPGWHHEYPVFRCQAEFKIEYKNGTGYAALNSGSWFSVSAEDTTFYLGIVLDKYENLFHGSRWKEEDQ